MQQGRLDELVYGQNGGIKQSGLDRQRDGLSSPPGAKRDDHDV